MLYSFIKRSTIYGGFARFRILVVAVCCCNALFGAGINQSDAEIAIDNACSFFVSGSWSRSDKNTFLDVDIVVKKQICCGLNQLRPMTPQHFDRCDVAYLCRYNRRI